MIKYLVLSLSVSFLLLTIACGGDDDSGSTSAPQSDAPADSNAADDDEDEAESQQGGPSGPGSASLTIGDETWEFDAFSCAFGHEATSSDIFSFSSDARGVHSSGARVQMQANIEDETGQGRYEGEGVLYEVHIDDIDDFDDPSVGWRSTNSVGFTGASGDTVIRIDGDNLTAEGLFDSSLTDEFELEPGTLTATCGSQSRR